MPSGGDQAEVFVPKTAVGVVIGKGGEMIKKIQGDTGCKLQFIQGKGDGPGDRRCIISGTKQQVEDAKRTIEDLIDSVMVSIGTHTLAQEQAGNNAIYELIGIYSEAIRTIRIVTIRIRVLQTVIMAMAPITANSQCVRRCHSLCQHPNVVS